MEFKVNQESDILNEDVRKNAIMFFCSSDNVSRKKEAIRREEIVKDQTKKYVRESFIRESSDKSVLQEIENRISNVSIGKKIINKKATVYKDGAERFPLDEKYKDQIASLVDYLDMDTAMKRVNQLNETHYNSIISCLPYKNNNEWCLKLKAYSPDKYDVITKFSDPEEAIVYVFSYETSMTSTTSDIQNAGVRGGERGESYSSRSSYYIWWSDNYHFTTNEKGQIISGMQDEKLLNPISMCPIVDFSKLKDCGFFNINGSDVADGSILINVLLTDMYYISKFQGMGLGYMFGKGVPQNMRVGPSSFVTVQMEQGDPTPEIGFASSNPQIDQHIAQIEQALALLLSTNSLDARTISGSLTASNAQSGIQEIIKRAENIDDIENQKEVYKDNEPEVFEIAFKWLNLYLNVGAEYGYLDEKLKKIGEIPEETEVMLKFKVPTVYTSEMDKLNVIEKRMDLGIDTLKDAIKKDNPDLSDKQIDKKLMERLNGEQSQLQDEPKENGNV